MGISEIDKTNNKAVFQIKKRDGRLVNFDESKIEQAIYKALIATGKPNFQLAKKLVQKVLKKMTLNSTSFDKSVIPSVEDVQDIVESILIEDGLSDTAKAYILYRHERRKIREDKMKILNKKNLDEVDKDFDLNSLRVLSSRYLLRNDTNEIVESPQQMFERVAILVALSDVLHDQTIFNVAGGHNQNISEATSYYNKISDFDLKLKIGYYYLNRYHFESLIRLYIQLASKGQMKVSFKELLKLIFQGKFKEYEDRIKEYYALMVSKDFLPNTPTLMNAGARLGQLSACFVLDMPDDMERIMKTSSDAAMIFKSGGGVGINYSDLRPEGDIVASTSGVASGPASFMRIIDTITDVVKQG
jgi:ribonucleoside-diphosphate reductase alpha chain